ncbi:UDP-N-acetylmuramate dehydrogenase [Orenia metallireducens]|uniref:UDP-N-acetylenolpyruvoylglucosamine reductase n=1 Tax=Orenia metallireducens TaxID=1413210 RepID=A0A285GW30_9FIRM|nr:UDP-N-acetylmuramate dehydrogenase [Orenia metallireducens]PRX31114.1 UDP-N-acetylmuramate dehydrogenase [Orenia metallireducens]SNY27514.1 UDP-N-acetylmuramate dehydrogenase [Orenia metallireducens]
MEELHKKEISSLIEGDILFDEPLKKYTSFKIGGPAELLAIPKGANDLEKLIKYLYQNNINYYLIGNGSNLLVSDRGLSGLVIKLPQKDVKLEFVGNRLIADAGLSLPLLSSKAAKRGLSGLEFAMGLPATLGGAIVMNAGIGDLRSIGDLIIKVKTLLATGEVKIYSSKELDFSYRSSPFQNSKEIILEAELELVPKDSRKIIKESKELLSKRKRSQPLKWPNAGCIFKNPPNDSAGRLIDQAGGKGLRIGDAQISTQHANFIVNLGAATAKEVLELMERVENLVLSKFGVNLKREIIFLS